VYIRNLAQVTEVGRPSPGPEDFVLSHFGGTHVDAGVLENVDHQAVNYLVSLFLLFEEY
jgi:hypothetical protein